MGRSATQIRDEIVDRFGFFPPFFGPALENPELLEGLWQLTLNAYVNNAVPAEFRERAFAYLSRFCSVPYCVVCHSCALAPMGLSGADVLAVLEMPAPSISHLDEELAALVSAPSSVHEWPASDSALGVALLRGVVTIFLHPRESAAVRREIARVLGPRWWGHLTVFVSYVRTCHDWVEAHPSIAFDEDERATAHLPHLLEDEPGLKRFFDAYFHTAKGELVDAERREAQARETQLSQALAVLEERITDRTHELSKTVAALAESEQRFRLVQRHAPIGLALLDLQGRWIEANPAMCDLLGREPSDLVGVSFQDVTHPDDVEANAENFQRLLAGELTVYETEKRYVRPDGGVVWGLLRSTMVRNNGAPQYLVAQVLDITDRRRAETELHRRAVQLECQHEELRRSHRDLVAITDSLRHAEERLKRILDTAGDAFISIDEHGTVHSWNHQATAILGWTATEAIGRPLHELAIPPDQRDAHLAGLARFLATGEGPLLDRTVQVEAIRSDGSTVPVELAIWATAGPNGWEFNALLRDITERLRQEAELHRVADELARSNADLTEFAYVAAHDLKSPLSTIKGFADLLDADADADAEFVRECTNEIGAGIQRMQALVDDLLTYCQVGTAPIDPRPVDLTDIARDVLWLLDADVTRQRATITLEDLPVVAGEPTQLRQVFQNLIGNALKFTRPGATPHIHVYSTTPADGQPVIEVSDNGVGIPPDHHDKVFAMFHRHSNSYEGTGIGLAICHRIVERHGGRIWVEKNVPYGTRMRMILPLNADHSHRTGRAV